MNTLSVPLHPFPARMAPEIAIRALDGLKQKRATVLDPMAGSGTTLVMAKAKGHSAIGYDCDPLSVLIARAWTRSFSGPRLRIAGEQALEIARNLYGTGSRCPRFPFDSDPETRAFIKFWFDDTNRRQLTALANGISLESNPTHRDLLWCAFSRLIIAKKRGASLASDLSHSRPHRSFKESTFRPLDEFGAAVDQILVRAPFADHPSLAGKARIKQGDARQLPLPDRSVDLILTSPPYLNAIDYIRGHKFSLVWMGWSIRELRHIRANAIGSEVGSDEMPTSPTFIRAVQSIGALHRLAPGYQRIVRRFLLDMQKVIFEMARVLKPGGCVTLVLGDSCLLGVPLRNSRAIQTFAAAAGLRMRSTHRRAIPPNRRYLPPPRNPSSGSHLRQRMSYETVIIFRSEY